MRIKPYICIKIECKSNERLLNLFRHKNVFMWNIRQADDGCIGYMYAEDYKKTRESVRKCNGKVKIIKKYGIAFVLFKYRKHFTFLIGIFLALALMSFLSLYVWNISFAGNSFYTDEVFERFMTSNGIRTGMFMSEVDCSLMEEKIRKQFEYVTWVSVQKNGTDLIVNIKENSSIKQAENNTEPRDIVSSVDGKIVSIITRAGTPLLKPGDEVKKGDVIVSGNINIYNDAGEVVSQKQTAADSDIVIEYQDEFNYNISRKHEERIETGKKIKHILFLIGDKRFETGLACKYEQYDKAEVLNKTKFSNDFYVPIYIGTITYSEIKIEELEYTEEEAENELQKNYNRYLNKLKENNVQICECSVKINENLDGYTINGIISAKGSLIQYTPVRNENNELKEDT